MARGCVLGGRGRREERGWEGGVVGKGMSIVVLGVWYVICWLLEGGEVCSGEMQGLEEEGSGGGRLHWGITNRGRSEDGER